MLAMQKHEAGRSPAAIPADITRLLGDLRPKLHRYCARMAGSVIDGEDILQDAMLKAVEALDAAGPLQHPPLQHPPLQHPPLQHPEGWLFRIAHNAALDFLRRRNRQSASLSDQDLELVVDPAATAEDRQIAAAGLRAFMHLPIAQRSSVILMDVLGYSLQEIAAITGTSIPAIKAALHRGRAGLQAIARHEERMPVLAEAERVLLASYVERFNARDFDAIRQMLADEVRLELVNKHRAAGRKQVANYFSNYASIADWRLAVGSVEGRPATLVFDPADPARKPKFFILLQWENERITGIRDFRYARYAIEDADIALI